MIKIIEKDISQAKKFLYELETDDIQKIMDGMKCSQIFDTIRGVVPEGEHDLEELKSYTLMAIECVYGLWQTNFESRQLWQEITGECFFGQMNDDIFDLTEKNLGEFVYTATGKEINDLLKKRMMAHIEENGEMFAILLRILNEKEDPLYIGCVAYFAIMFGLWRYEETL